MPRRLTPLQAALLTLVIAGCVTAVASPLRRVFYELTGEESLWEGFKGVAALAILRLRHTAPDTADAAVGTFNGQGQAGVNTFLELEVEPDNVRRQLDLIAEAGFGWIRQEFPWEDIEIHSRGDFQDRRHQPARAAWAKYDLIVDEARRRGIRILARLDKPPAWSRSAPPDGTFGPPDDLDHFGDFVAAVAHRYCGRVRHFQIWNEPNIYPEWGNRPVSPEGYVQLLSVAAARVRQSCPGSVIVSAALAPTLDVSERAMNDLAYLRRMYEADAARHFDVLAVQAFGLWTGPTDRRASPDRTNFARPQLLRAVMVHNGDAAKPVWITEMGWPAVPPGMATQYGRVTAERQARYLVQAYERLSAWPWVGPAFVWFFRRPDERERDQAWYYFRLVEPNWQLTPAYNSLKEYLTGRVRQRSDSTG